MSGQIDSFGDYVRGRLDEWGVEFNLQRNCEYLGHQSKNILQVLIDHRGEMPGRTVGFKPIEVSRTAQEIEDIVADIARDQMPIACTLRGYYCGAGRRKTERFETANFLMVSMGFTAVNVRRYMTLHDLGVQTIRGALIGISRAA